MHTPAHRTDGKPRRLARLIAFVEANHAATKESGNALVSAADLKALLGLLKAAAKEVPAAVTVPEWDNHLDDNGEPVGLGDACATYAAWVEDAEVDHDGACQVASVAESLRLTLNALDRISDAN
jgi:hypothetical protein